MQTGIKAVGSSEGGEYWPQYQRKEFAWPGADFGEGGGEGAAPLST